MLVVRFVMEERFKVILLLENVGLVKDRFIMEERSEVIVLLVIVVIEVYDSSEGIDVDVLGTVRIRLLLSRSSVMLEGDAVAKGSTKTGND